MNAKMLRDASALSVKQVRKGVKFAEKATVLAILLFLVGIAFSANAPRWAVMWSLALVIYALSKWLVFRVAEENLAEPADPGAMQAWFILWPGMDPAPFLETTDPVRGKVSGGQWIRAFALASAGLSLIYIGARHVPAHHDVARGWIGMAGLLLTLHFGVFELLALFWKSRGIRVRSIMSSPHRATSVAEFWGGRWNRAFRDLAWTILVRPLRGRVRAPTAVLLVFAVSGLVHELVISYPARAGYGGPAGYFLIQGISSIAQRTRIAKLLGLHGGFRGWVFTMTCVLAPAFWLFHPAFMRDVFVPFMRAIGAL
jgi:alginate O-acetyltransferase complex protein AlgI